jgi:hypothetical protein
MEDLIEDKNENINNIFKSESIIDKIIFVEFPKF